MASRVNICTVNILDNPSMFLDKFRLEITFEVFEHLPHDLEWELVYVGSGASREYDQVLDSVLVGPVPEGRHKFVFEAGSPSVDRIPADDVVGVSVLLLRCKYNEQEFINLGWFVSNEYTDEELKENPPSKPLVDKLTRKVQTDDLRVTTFSIKWGETDEALPVEESDKVFAEEELMPTNDDDDPEEESDDEEDGEEAEGEVDLNESIEKVNEQVSQALDSMDVEQLDDDNAQKRASDHDEAMEDVSQEANECGDSLQINDKTVTQGQVPLIDRTNDVVN